MKAVERFCELYVLKNLSIMLSNGGANAVFEHACKLRSPRLVEHLLTLWFQKPSLEYFTEGNAYQFLSQVVHYISLNYIRPGMLLNMRYLHDWDNQKAMKASNQETTLACVVGVDGDNLTLRNLKSGEGTTTVVRRAGLLRAVDMWNDFSCGIEKKVKPVNIKHAFPTITFEGQEYVLAKDYNNCYYPARISAYRDNQNEKEFFSIRYKKKVHYFNPLTNLI